MSDPVVRAKLRKAWEMRPGITMQTRAALSEASNLAYERQPELRVMRAVTNAKRLEQWPLPKTTLECALACYLQRLEVAFKEQKRFGRYVVDAYVEDTKTAYEADGLYWHRDKEREAKRDAYLIARGIARVVHLSEHDLIGFLKGR